MKSSSHLANLLLFLLPLLAAQAVQGLFDFFNLGDELLKGTVVPFGNKKLVRPKNLDIIENPVDFYDGPKIYKKVMVGSKGPLKIGPRPFLLEALPGKHDGRGISYKFANGYRNDGDDGLYSEANKSGKGFRKTAIYFGPKYKQWGSKYDHSRRSDYGASARAPAAPVSYSDSIGRPSIDFEKE